MSEGKLVEIFKSKEALRYEMYRRREAAYRKECVERSRGGPRQIIHSVSTAVAAIVKLKHFFLSFSPAC